MKNYIQTGDHITVAAPATIVSGQAVEIGELFGVASTDADQNADVAIVTTGVFTLPKEATDNVSVGEALYWDSANGAVTIDDQAGNRVGVAVEAAIAPVATIAVKIG